MTRTHQRSLPTAGKTGKTSGPFDMPNSDYFWLRAIVYRQRALDAGSGGSAEVLFVFANLFARIADDMRALEQARTQTSQLRTNPVDALRRAIARGALAR